MAEEQTVKQGPEFIFRAGGSPSLRWLGGVALALATVGGGWLAWLVWSQPAPMDPGGLTVGVLLICTALLLGYIGLVLRRDRRTIAAQAQAVADEQSVLARYRLLAEHTREIILLVRHSDGQILEANRAAAEAYQYERPALRERNIRDLRAGGPPQDADEQMQAARASGLLYVAEHQRRDGSVFPVEISACGGQMGGESVILQVIRDITERRQAADEHRALQGLFEQAQKLDTLGRLAGGVAHDFNNLLQIILGITDLLLDETAPTDHSAPQLRQLRAAAEKARTLTQQLLLFSRREPATPQALNCNSVVREIEPVLRRLLPPNIRIALHLVDKAPPIQVHAGQLQQVLMNLALNARDAMPSGGQLTIETEHVILTAADTARHPDLEAKPYVRLLVSDTGVGLSPEARAHLFEPFFTTKAPGEGAGLGLATVYGIVKQWGGAIISYSEPNQGTAFKAYLPVMSEAAPPPGPGGPDQGAEPLPLEGSETVLLAEDDAGVRRMTARALRKFGYDVIEAEDGAEALRKVAAATKPVQVLVTDLVMPEVGGRELADRLQEQQPALKVIFISGFSEKGAWARGLLPPDAVFLSKPFALAELVRVIRTQCAAPR